MRDVFFDLSYGGLSLSIEDVSSWDYATIIYLMERMKTQKNHERKEIERSKIK